MQAAMLRNPKALGAWLVLLTLVLFWPATRYGFIGLDDDTYVAGNPYVQQGLNRQSVVWALTTAHENYWLPVTWLSFVVDRTLQGPNPPGYHRTNVVLHAANVLLVFVLGYGLTGHLWGSALVAALFGWHPLRIEAVVWISSRKDVLSTFFGLLAMLAYIRYVRCITPAKTSAIREFPFALVPRPRPRLANGLTAAPEVEGQGRKTKKTRVARWCFYLFVCLAMTLSLMAKPMWVTLPFLLLLLDFWPLRRTSILSERREDEPQSLSSQSRNPRLVTSSPASVGQRLYWLLLEKIPLLLIALGFSAITLSTHISGNAIHSLNAVPLTERLLQIPLHYWDYLGKAVWPVDLAVRYPPTSHFPVAQSAAAGVLLLAISGIFAWQARRRPWLLMGWLWFLGTLVPMIGLVRIGTADFADRFTYVPSIGLGVLVAGGLFAWRGHARQALLLPMIAGLVLVAGSAAATRYQMQFWASSEILFRRAIDITRNNAAAHNALGQALENQGRLAEALAQYRESLRIAPHFGQAHANLGNALGRQGRYDDAITHFVTALEVMTNDARIHSNYGSILFKTGQAEEGLRHLRQAIQMNPRLADAHFNLGQALLDTGNPADALPHFVAATGINPRDDAAHFLAGRIYLSMGKGDLARHHFQAAFNCRPDHPDYLRALNSAVPSEGAK